MDNKEKIARLKLKAIYYYLRYFDGSRSATCLLVNENGDLMARGISLCSRRDQFIRRLGRAMAQGRAVQALEHQYPSANGNLHFDMRKVEYLPDCFDYELPLLKNIKKAAGKKPVKV